MKHATIAFDSSHREYDNNGFLHVRACNLTKEQVAPYYGREIPNYQEAGFDPNKVYYGYRSAEELSRPETVKSINGIPIQLRHHLDYPEAPAKETRVGQTGTDGVWQAPYLKNSLHILDKAGMDAVDGECKELSLAYAYRPEFTSGETEDGTHYDFVMRDILAQHLALVESGRAGRDVVVCDSSLKEDDMPTEEKKPEGVTLEEEKITESAPTEGAKDEGEELVEQKIDAVLSEFNLPEDVLVKVKALILGTADEAPKPEEEVKVEEKVEQDEETAPVAEAPAIEEKKEVIEFAEDVANALKECGYDSDTDPCAQAFAKGFEYGKAHAEPKAQDEDKEEEDAKVAQDAALQSQKAELEKEFIARFDAIRDCRSVIGDVKFTAFDCAGDVYVSALKKLGVTKGIDSSNARACFDVYMQTKKAVVAEDKAHDDAQNAMAQILSNVKE